MKPEGSTIPLSPEPGKPIHEPPPRRNTSFKGVVLRLVTGTRRACSVMPTCEYHRVDVSAYRDEELRGAMRLHGALLTLKYVFRDELTERLPGILGLLRELEAGSSGLDFSR